MAVKPSGLKSNGASAYRPVRPVLRDWEAATYHAHEQKEPQQDRNWLSREHVQG